MNRYYSTFHEDNTEADEDIVVNPNLANSV